MGAGKPLHLGQQRRLGRLRRPPERALQRARGARDSAACVSRGTARPRVGRQVAVAVERHRHPEQALDHALVHLPREVDPLLQLLGVLGLGRDRPGDRGQRRRLAERPQQLALGGVERRCVELRGRRGSPRSPGRRRASARTRAASAPRPARRTRAGTDPRRSPATSITWSAFSAWAAIGAESTETWAPANCPTSSPWAPAARTCGCRGRSGRSPPGASARAGRSRRRGGRRSASPALTPCSVWVSTSTNNSSASTNGRSAAAPARSADSDTSEAIHDP